MSRPPVVSGQDAVRAFAKLGYTVSTMSHAPATDEPTPASCPLCGRLVNPAYQLRDRIHGIKLCMHCRHRFVYGRLAAFIIDFMIIRLFVAAGNTHNVAMPEWSVLFICCAALVFKDSFSGRSPGKWVLGLRAIDADNGTIATVSQCLKRNSLHAIPLIGTLIAAGHLPGRHPGDRWARTMVIPNHAGAAALFGPKGPYCLDCGYDLTGNVSGRCPECGLTVATFVRE